MSKNTNKNRIQFFDKPLTEKGIESSEVKLLTNKIPFCFSYIAERSVDFIKLYNEWCAADSDGKKIDGTMKKLVLEAL